MQVPPTTVACLNATTCLAASASTAANAPAVVAETTDTGSTWSALTGPTIGNPGNIACAQGTSTCVLLGSKGMLAATDDGGLHWTTTKVRLGTLGSQAALTLASCATAQNCIVTTVAHTVEVSTDGGKSYSTSTLEGGTNSRAAYCTAGGTCLMGGGVGGAYQSAGVVLRSTNGGKTWTQVWQGK
jgi:photosystem II stability/assembly factor-like uncharacterized protein